MLRNAVPASAPLWGFLFPSGSQRSTGSALQKPTFAQRPISLRSPRPDSTMHDADRGSTFQVRYVPRGSLFPCTSWNQVHDAPDRSRSQTNSQNSLPFSSGVSAIRIRRMADGRVEITVDKTESYHFVFLYFSLRIMPVSVAAHSSSFPAAARMTRVATAR